MTISGDLQDVSVAEVMQFIHLGRRTGTLNIRRGSRRAEIGFHRGRIISAWSPESKRLGELLIEGGIVPSAVLEDVLRRQRSRQPAMSIGQLLIEEGVLTLDDLRSVLGHQIEQTIYDLVTWREGSFDFALDELRPVDDIGLYPGDILPHINLDTQMVVLDALRIFDEKNRHQLAMERGASEDRAAGETLREQLRREEDLAGLFDDESESGDAVGERGASETEPPAAVRLQMITEDDDLRARLEEAMPSGLARLAAIESVDAGLSLPGEPPPFVLLDLRGHPDLTRLENLGRSRPRASILAIVEPERHFAGVYAAGALAALPPDAESIASCLRNIAGACRASEAAAAGLSARSGFARLRRVVADLRAGLLSATVALNLMQVISESVERAVMFLVRDDNLLALGAFGSSMDGEPLAHSTSGLAIHVDHGGALSQAIEDGQTRSLCFEDAGLPAQLARLLGRPHTGQVVIFPVLGSARVISVVYADNGHLGREIEEIEILDLAAAQVGVAFENEMLRRKMERRPSEGRSDGER